MTSDAPRRARKRFGQNFLEPAWAAKVVRAIAPDATDTFIEIGPGRGALTRPLSLHAQIVAVEIDRDLVRDLQSASLPRVTVVSGDFLDLSVEELRRALPSIPGALRAAGNLPYNVASPILSKLDSLYAAGLPISDATVMLQREVADRLTAPPGSRDYGVLTIRIRYRADVTRLIELPPGAFRPSPKVHSSVVRLRFRPPGDAARNEAVLRAVTEAIFSRRRKTLVNALQALEDRRSGSERGLTRTEAQRVLADAGLDGTRRPETLSIQELVRLSDRVGAVLY